LKSKYSNPVKIEISDHWQTSVNHYLDNYSVGNPIVVATSGTLNRIDLKKLFRKESIFSHITPNPTFQTCKKAIQFILDKQFDGVIAIGGGSTLDTAKVVMASLGTKIYDINGLLNYELEYPYRVPSAFIPTTHGTASEVTKWGTIWNTQEKLKYSISHYALYPDIAILDGSLTVGLPMDISLSTSLDALSHSFEAIWNINSNRVSTEYAIEAICLIIENIHLLKFDPNNLKIRSNLLVAANKAGLAFSNTRTGAAHSISYPLTINYNIPHGIAASMPLIPLLKINSRKIQNELGKIIFQLGLSSLNGLIDKIEKIPKNYLKYSLCEWGTQQKDIELLAREIIENEKTGNNIVPLSKDKIKSILMEIY